MVNGASIFRIFVPVSDFASAVTFYSRLLADEGRTVHGGRQYYDCGSVILAVIEKKGTPIEDHIYFSVSDLETIFDRARELGCLEDTDIHGAPAGEIVTRPWRERSFYVRDPFGNGLCFVDEATLFTGI